MQAMSGRASSKGQSMANTLFIAHLLAWVNMAGGRIRPPACSTSPSISECDRRAARLPLTPSGGSLSVTAAAAGSFHIFLVFLPLSVAVIDFDYL